jgi:S-disulfanyl-L-cysteine oxidoreductase SoxD
MCRFEGMHRRLLVAGMLWAAALATAYAAPAVQFESANKAPAGIGRTATAAEIRAWDIDVRPDFKGLPPGQGSVKQGEALWEAQCVSCHGSFGESSQVFTPLAGGIGPLDIKSGRVDGLLPGANQPQRTTLMKLSTLSTLWDYIYRAMPWNAPKTLSANEVYALTAYILNLNNVLPADFTLSEKNIREVQALLPNRNGMTTAHAMWPGKELNGSNRPDVQGSACMRNCQADPAVKSFLPDYARNSHGNLAGQSRLLGPSRGADTTHPPRAFETGSVSEQNMPPALENRAPPATKNIAIESASPAFAGSTTALAPLLQKNACAACHGMDNKLIGPSFRDIAEKYKSRVDAVAYLSGKIRSGGQGVWGAIPMPPQGLSKDEAAQVAQWLAEAMPK